MELDMKLSMTYKVSQNVKTFDYNKKNVLDLIPMTMNTHINGQLLPYKIVPL